MNELPSITAKTPIQADVFPIQSSYAYEHAINDVLDDALRLLAQGYDAECCARQFPQYTDQLYPLLLVMEALLDLRDDADTVNYDAGLHFKALDWTTLCEPLPAT